MYTHLRDKEYNMIMQGDTLVDDDNTEWKVVFGYYTATKDNPNKASVYGFYLYNVNSGEKKHMPTLCKCNEGDRISMLDVSRL